MADDADWSDYTSMLVDEIDKKLNKKYGITARALLSNPGRYSNQDDISTTAGNMKEAANKVLDGIADDLKDERNRMNDDLSKVDSISNQLRQNISMQAKQTKTPLIKPALVERNEDNDMVLYISTVDDSTFTLVEKLATGSKFVIDYGYAYGSYKVGAWLFSGDKNYMLRVYIPQNEAMLFDASREEINSMFDAAISLFGGA